MTFANFVPCSWAKSSSTVSWKLDAFCSLRVRRARRRDEEKGEGGRRDEEKGRGEGKRRRVGRVGRDEGGEERSWAKYSSPCQNWKRKEEEGRGEGERRGEKGQEGRRERGGEEGEDLFVDLPSRQGPPCLHVV
jgi:hypothetical protein